MDNEAFEGRNLAWSRLVYSLAIHLQFSRETHDKKKKFQLPHKENQPRLAKRFAPDYISSNLCQFSKHI